MTNGYYKASLTRGKWVAVYAVDEHGCLLHTEPVCTIPVEYHRWFLDHLEGQLIPVQFPDLLHHDEVARRIIEACST